MVCMHGKLSRRRFVSLTAGACALSAGAVRAAGAPTMPVAIGKCPDYGSSLEPALERVFDQLGGLGRLVKGKTVAIKINMVGGPGDRFGYTPLEESHWTHPRVIGAAVHLIGKAGARRIRILEGAWSTADPLEENMLEANWEPRDILNAAPQVEFENTNWLGSAKKYSRLWVPGGGYMFKAFDVNHSYEDCDVFVSATKLKMHATAGVTLSIKNCFGMTPITIYGEGAGVDEPSQTPRGGRTMLHNGSRQPSKSAVSEINPGAFREAGYRIPRILVDLAAARPIHLSIIEGIRTMVGGEGPWNRDCKMGNPQVLVAGLNPVCTDAVGMALMGFDPMATRGTAPFETCDNTLELAQRAGLGSRDLQRIEVAGAPIRDVVFDYRKYLRDG